MPEQLKRKQRITAIIIAYPLGLLLIGALVNAFVFGINPPVAALPSPAAIASLVIAAAVLVINHAWLMTSTELTRLRFNLHATPEEWAASGRRPQDAPEDGVRELERRHAAHRNTTENTVYFTLLAFVFVLVSPPTLAMQIWIIGFAAARLGYTYCYLSARDGARGLFMSLSLLAMFGMASYLALSLAA